MPPGRSVSRPLLAALALGASSVACSHLPVQIKVLTDVPPPGEVKLLVDFTKELKGFAATADLQEIRESRPDHGRATHAALPSVTLLRSRRDDL